MPSKIDLYNQLGISKNATPEEIKQAFFQSARRLHPDVNIQSNANEQFLLIKEAYEILSNPQKRAKYDNNYIREITKSPVNIEILYSRNEILRLTEKQLIYTLLDIHFYSDNDQETATRIPINAAIVLDVSTSMRGSRLQAIKSTTAEIIHKLTSNDILSIVSFSDRSKVIIPASHPDAAHSLEPNIRRLQTHGGTEIFQGLLAGFSEIRKNLSARYHNHIILITDGRTYGDEIACLDLADQCASLGVAISCLGIGSEWNDEFLDELAKRTGGTSKYVATSRGINDILPNIFTELERVVAARIEFDFNLGTGVDLLYAFRIHPELGVLPLTSPIQFGGCPKDSFQRILFEFQVSPLNQDIKHFLLLSGELKINIPQVSESNYQIPLSFIQKVSNSPEQPIPPPQLIVESMSKLTLYRMHERANKFFVEGKIDEAKEQLQNLATHLLSKGENKLSKTVLLEVEHLEKQKRYSDSGNKEIKYGTRALLLPNKNNAER
ncbi:MAG TPA: VWA domain-containing protein [Anaerolineae bacterium]|nr:VWA domain-containing protein [Anaerolineae bacterium]